MKSYSDVENKNNTVDDNDEDGCEGDGDTVSEDDID